jgi:hypothetical protein
MCWEWAVNSHIKAWKDFERIQRGQVACGHFEVKLQREDTRKKVGLGKAVDGAGYLRRIGK